MKFQEQGFFTPPPQGLKSNRNSPVKMPRSANGNLFHVIHKVPPGDSPYVRAKRVQMIDKDPSKSVSLFWTAINSGDRVDSALKDMALVMKQLDRCDEAIEAIKSFRHLCSPESQESIDNLLLELYKRCCRFEEENQLLLFKLNNIEQDFIFAGKRTKISRFQGKKIYIPIEKEYSRLLGNIAWSNLQKSDYKSAEVYYRKALSFEFDRNKQCNLAVCLIHLNKMHEAELLLQSVNTAYKQGEMDESCSKSFERALQMLDDFRTRVAKPSSSDQDRVVHLEESSIQGKKSWADMVEEDEEEKLVNEFPYENQNVNIVVQTQTPCSIDQDKPLNDGYYTQPLQDISVKNQVTRRSLCFDEHHV